MELLSGCAIITAYEKAVNRIQILVVGANISCAAPPTAPAISISLEMHRWRQSRPHRSPFGVGNCAEFCMAAGPKFTAKAPEIPGFQALSWYYNQPVVFKYGTCRSSAIATSCIRTLSERFCHRCVGFGIPAAVSHPFPICLHSAKAPGLFCGYPCPVVSGGQPAWPPIFQITTCSLIRQYSVTGGCFPSAGLAVRLRLHGFGKVDAVLHIAQVLVHCGGGCLLVIAHDS